MTTKHSTDGRTPVIAYVYLGILLGVSVSAVLVVWPYSPEELHSSRLSAELRQLLLVTAGALLGSSLGGLRRLAVNRADSMQPKRSMWLYGLDIMFALPTALMAYVALRGLILTSDTGIEHINSSGILFLSVLVGFYGPESIVRLVDELTLREKRDAPLRDGVERISSALGISILDNFRGFVCLKLEEAVGGFEVKQSEDGRYSVAQDSSYRVKVWFVPSAPESVPAELVEISDGQNVKTVEFTFSADTDIGRVAPRKASLSFDVETRSETISFDLSVNARAEGFGKIFVEVLQKNRLVQVISADLLISSTRR